MGANCKPRYNLYLNDSGGRENFLLAAVLLSDSYDHNHGFHKCALHRDDRGGRKLHYTVSFEFSIVKDFNAFLNCTVKRIAVKVTAIISATGSAV